MSSLNQGADAPRSPGESLFAVRRLQFKFAGIGFSAALDRDRHSLPAARPIADGFVPSHQLVTWHEAVGYGPGGRQGVPVTIKGGAETDAGKLELKPADGK